MKFVERLQGTGLEEDPKAYLVCGILDFCKDAGCSTPTVREWSRLLQCMNKDIRKAMSVRQVQKLMTSLSEEGVISLVAGEGRNRSTFDLPDNGNLLADKKAAYEKRRGEWKQQVIEKLKGDVEKGTANWDGVKSFFEYWSEPDAEYNMRWENRMKDEKKKYFSIGGRWSNWKTKIIDPTKAITKTDFEARTEEIAEREARNKKAKKTKSNLEDVQKMKKEWLKSKGETEWTDELLKEYAEYTRKQFENK